MSEPTPYREPAITKVSQHGHVSVAWPDPPRPVYDVSHDVIADWVMTLNRIADLRAMADVAGSVSAEMIREVLGT